MIVHSVKMLGFQLLTLSIHIHIEAFSTTSVINLIDVVLFLLVNPNLVKALQSDWATNPLQPLLIQSQLTYHPFNLHCSISSRYLVSFLLWDLPCFPPTIPSTPTWSLASSYTEQESCVAEVMFEQYDQEISAPHRNQQIIPNLGLC